ncbi:MAG: ABC transporter ATP-binding protein [Pseudomonadota bacterium]
MAEAKLVSATKRFGRITAVDDVSLTVADGEFLVLLGPTGAGKTTTLRLLAGLEKPDQGQVEIDSDDVTSLPPAVRDVAFVFQQYSLYPHYSVFDNLAFPLKAPGRQFSKDEIKQRVGEVAEMLRIAHKLDNLATQLSGGEMQRVSLGRALVREPTLFLMDEPLSSLDAKLREELRLELKRIQRDLGATIVFVIHDQLEAMTLADRIGVLREGRLVQTGTPQEVYQRPSSVYAAQRLGSPPINLLDIGTMGLPQPPAGAMRAGVRPEDVEVAAADGPEAQVLAVERLGVETVALLDLNGQQVRALLDAHVGLSEGATTKVAFRAMDPIWFDGADHRIANV